MLTGPEDALIFIPQKKFFKSFSWIKFEPNENSQNLKYQIYPQQKRAASKLQSGLVVDKSGKLKKLIVKMRKNYI